MAIIRLQDGSPTNETMVRIRRDGGTFIAETLDAARYGKGPTRQQALAAFLKARAKPITEEPPKETPPSEPPQEESSPRQRRGVHTDDD